MQIIAKDGPEPGAGAKKEGFYARDGLVEHAGDFFVIELLVLAQDEGKSLGFREGIEGFFQNLHQFAPESCRGSISRLGVGKVVEGIQILAFWAGGRLFPLPAPFAFEMGENAVAADGEEPSGKFGIGPITGRRPIDFEEDLLGNVFGLGRVVAPEHPSDGGIDPVLMFFDQAGERGMVSLRRLAQPIRFLWPVHLGAGYRRVVLIDNRTLGPLYGSMAGHSHWSQIKRAKGAADLKRGQLFSKLAKEITVAVRLGGGDPNFNPRLRTAIAAARAESMPLDNIERAIKKGTGELEGGALEEIAYEGFGPGGAAILVETATDNKNRTAAEMRALFSRGGGNLGSVGSVAWMFKRKGFFFFEGGTEEALLEPAIEAGAEDVREVPGGVEVLCPPDQFYATETALKERGFVPKEGKLIFVPENLTPLADPELAQKVMALIEKLEEHDDVQNVYTNVDMATG